MRVFFSVRSTLISKLIYGVEVCSNYNTEQSDKCCDTIQLFVAGDLCRSASCRTVVECWLACSLFSSHHDAGSIAENVHVQTVAQLAKRLWNQVRTESMLRGDAFPLPFKT